MYMESIIGHRRIQHFFREGLRDEFIRMCTDCIVVKIHKSRDPRWESVEVFPQNFENHNETWKALNTKQPKPLPSQTLHQSIAMPHLEPLAYI